MRGEIADVTKDEVRRLISSKADFIMSPKDEETFERCLAFTEFLRLGKINNETVCAWGLIPPTLLSDTAYLWLYTTDKVKGHEFIFVRHSQRAIEEILSMYPRIVGHVRANAPHSIRWLKWLGAKLQEGENGLLPFVIERKNNG